LATIDATKTIENDKDNTVIALCFAGFIGISENPDQLGLP